MIVKQQPRKSESPETQRWPRNGQNAKVEASSSCLAMGTLEAAERHKPKYWGHRNGKAGQRAFHWGSVNLRLRPHLSYSSQARKNCGYYKRSCSAGADRCLCWNWWFPFHDSTVSVPSLQGHELLWVSMKLHCGTKGWQVLSNITGKKAARSNENEGCFPLF